MPLTDWADAAPFGIATSPSSLARPMPTCGSGKRMNCVVDGDTFWMDGEKIRIESIDAPEIAGRCARETRLAAQARKRLSALLDNQPVTIVRNGSDRFGRTLATVRAPSGEVGRTLVHDGLAQPWLGKKAQWCNV